MHYNFTYDELAMISQYAANTKQETLAGLKEILPTIRDQQTKDVVVNTIQKLEAIPESECIRLITQTRQKSIQERDEDIRRRLNERENLLDEIEEERLLKIAEERIAHAKPEDSIPFEDVVKGYGFTVEEIYKHMDEADIE